MQDDELKERVRNLAMEEIGHKQWGCFYLSWADPDKFLGGAFVYGYGPITARLRCKALGINPGGQCWITRLPPEYPVPEESNRNRLLTRDEILNIDPDSANLSELEKEKKPC